MSFSTRWMMCRERWDSSAQADMPSELLRSRARGRVGTGDLLTCGMAPGCDLALPEVVSGCAPSAADGMRARFADVDPRRDVDLLEVELEQRVVVGGLDHAPDAASRDDTADQCRGVGVPGDLSSDCSNAELVIIGPWHRVDHAARVSPQVVAFR